MDGWIDGTSRNGLIKHQITERYNVVVVYPVSVFECPGVCDDVLVGEDLVHQHHLAVEDTLHLPHLLLLLHLLPGGQQHQYHWLNCYLAYLTPVTGQPSFGH